MGPLNNEGVATKMDEHLADAVGKGAAVVAGEAAEGYRRREPTVTWTESQLRVSIQP